MSAPRYEYSGDASLAPRIDAALHRVVDPEMAIDIVEMGLVYAVRTEMPRVEVRITMTSAACPVSELIAEDIAAELRRELGETADIEVELAWDPPWTPERMSERARSALDWD